MKVGFTGTRKGMDFHQKMMVGKKLFDLKAMEFHHGDCDGGDEAAHSIARKMGLKMVIHPPADSRYRAFCDIRAGDERREPKAYLARNADIVDETEWLIACLWNSEVLRSGTWSTIRYARKVSRNTTIIYPKESQSPREYHQQ